MPEFDLDSFKKTWQEQPVQKKYDDNEILKMLNRKSRNYVKYIFWISVAEFLLFSVMGIFYFFQNEEDNGFLNILEKLGAQKTQQIESSFDIIYWILKVSSLIVTAYFVLKFYQNYRKIRIEENLKGLITRILTFKKTVNAFILISILLLVAFTSIFTIFIFYSLNEQNVEPKSSELTIFVVGIIVTTAFSVLLIWLYYRLVYGIIMSKLDKNLKQLREIDSQEV
ncbi:beta-carotene 15,15'-monooxygenase [Chryseobacterium shandongense]|jgi:hypothetical protein|uniref:Beta-carotene 15,15'-monooxygenase n=1 Tax=Chryseobacterium shandongense TaxID=1493872 RepID=A0A3G6MS20_9FLAO|nr:MULTISPECIES: beta-carotene 15,15'-monooxygenase [Chryseobacterium]AZA58484.1 beta-carotene 15,15'-monooxygenase [Chryseobacterium shandongense]AZA86725.1 beta-carotene 15,15'-monooxygenase [Chryseobacterium shandongense]AZA95138.1 beta-carotene 15,15'-monooxygenase [Chryseobacterium shandongense]